MFTCYLCSQETVYTSYFCSACNETRMIFSLYGAKECRDILKRVCIREPVKRSYKISAELKKEIESKGDETYIKNGLKKK